MLSRISCNPLCTPFGIELRLQKALRLTCSANALSLRNEISSGHGAMFKFFLFLLLIFRSSNFPRALSARILVSLAVSLIIFLLLAKLNSSNVNSRSLGNGPMAPGFAPKYGLNFQAEDSVRFTCLSTFAGSKSSIQSSEHSSPLPIGLPGTCKLLVGAASSSTFSGSERKADTFSRFGTSLIHLL